MGRVNDIKPSDIEIPPGRSKSNKKPENKPKTRTHTSTTQEHKQKVEWDLIQKATITLWVLLGVIVVLAAGDFILYGMFGWGHNDFIREIIRLLGSVITLILGFLFGTSRK